jgi:hypothetical protein
MGLISLASLLDVLTINWLPGHVNAIADLAHTLAASHPWHVD